MVNKTPDQDIVEGQILEVEYGRNLIIPVYGETGAQEGKQSAAKKLYKKYGDKHLRFSLTPICKYQEDKDWPERPFLNVNVLGSLETTKDNWLGYIHPYEPEEKDKVRLERQKYIEKLIKLGEINPLVISGKVIKEGSEYSLLLFASRKYIDETLAKVTKLQKKWEEDKKAKQKKMLMIGVPILIALIVLCIFFWKYVIGVVVLVGIVILLLAKK